MTQKHILFKTQVSGSGVGVEILNKEVLQEQHDHASLGMLNEEYLKITFDLSKLLKFPLNTVFIATNISLAEGEAGDSQTQFTCVSDHTFSIVEQKALYLDDTVFVNPSTPTKNPTSEELMFLFQYILGSTEDRDIAAKRIESLANMYAAYGYTFDVAAILNPPVPETMEEAAASGTMWDFIRSKYPAPSRAKTGFYIDPDTWFLLVRNVLRGENTLLVGPTGSGKTEILTYLAEALEKPLYIQDMGTVQDAQSALLGVHRLNKDGHSEFDPAPFVGHIQSGGIVLLDELNRAPLAANNVLFPCLDSRRYLPIDIACGDADRHIAVAEGTVFFATANLGAEYSGTNAIDRALLDRFFPVELSYPKENEEVRVLVKRTGVDEKSAKAIVKVAGEVRKQYKSQELSNAISVRHTLQIASLVKDGLDLNKALTTTIMPLFEDGIGASERTRVKTIIAAY